MGISTAPPSVTKRTIWPMVLVVLHFICFICGFCVAIPVSVSKGFGGCPLYATASTVNLTTDNSTGSGGEGWELRLIFHPGNRANCDYVEAITSIFCIVYSTAVMALNIFIFLKASKDGIPILNPYLDYLMFGMSVSNAVGWVFLLVAASMVSQGLTQWCGDLLETFDVPWYISCEEFMKLYPQNSGVDDSFDFYTHLYTAEVSIWLCLMVWLLITLIGFFNTWRMGAIPCISGTNQPNSGSEQPQSESTQPQTKSKQPRPEPRKTKKTEEPRSKTDGQSLSETDGQSDSD